MPEAERIAERCLKEGFREREEKEVERCRGPVKRRVKALVPEGTSEVFRRKEERESQSGDARVENAMSSK